MWYQQVKTHTQVQGYFFFSEIGRAYPYSAVQRIFMKKCIIYMYNIVVDFRGGGVPEGGTHMLRHTGMCRKNGSLFCKKSLIMGPIFIKNIPIFGSDFQNFPVFAIEF